EALLALHPGQFVDDVHVEYIRVGLRRKPTFPNVGVKWVLRNRRGNPARAQEDFAGVIDRFAPGVRHIERNAMETPYLEFVLPAVVSRPGTVVTNAQVGEVAIDAACRVGIASRSRLRRSTGHNACRYKAGRLNSHSSRAGLPRESGANQRVAINRLE